jgi:hypothetical protein
MSARIDPTFECLLPRVALGTVGRDRLELPLEALQGCEICSLLGGHKAYCAV